MGKSIKAAALAAAALCAVAFGAGEARAEEGVTAIIPFPAGGPTDKVAREALAIMARELGEPIKVENVAGGAGSIGARKAAKADPDGKTILVHHIGMATAPSLSRNLGFDPQRDFEPIGEIADSPMALVGATRFGPNNARELLAEIASNPRRVTLANAGVGSASHLCGLLLQSSLQTELTTVPYKGTGPALDDLKKGQVSIMCDQTTNLSGAMKSGEIKSYLAMQDTRIGAFPQMPAGPEAGVRGAQVVIWLGAYAPKGTPKARVAKLSAALQKAVANPEFRAKMAAQGAEAVSPARATPEALRSKLASEIAKWGPVIKKAGVYAD